MTDTEQKLFEQLSQLNEMCKAMGLNHCNFTYLDAKPWAVSVKVQVNLNQLHEIVQKAYEKGIKVMLQSFENDDEESIVEWRNPLSKPIWFYLDIEEEAESISAYGNLVSDI